MVQRKRIGAFWQVDQHGIVHSFGAVVFVELLRKASDLDADHGVHLGIEIWRPYKDLRCDLIFLKIDTRMVDGSSSQVP